MSSAVDRDRGDGRYSGHLRELLADADAHAARADWAGVRDLAGAALALAPASETAMELLAAAERHAPSYGDRRQLTVMFCDVVGSTSMSHRHDPEVVREVLRSYQVACDACTRRYGGRVAQYIGDGALVYFGHPVTHEDDPRRAVRAGLDLLEALQPVIEEARARYGIELGVRIAVHTGLVVYADMGSPASPDRNAIVGATPNLAARLQDHARPGSLVISAATLDLVRGWFQVIPLGELMLKGFDAPIAAYEVVEETPGASRVTVQADLSPFVGRAEELRALDDAWAEVVAGGARTVLITGEAGVGKSRLADVLRRRVEREGHVAVVAGCSTYHAETALYPVRRMIEHAVGLGHSETGHSALARLWTALDEAGQSASTPFLADLLGLPPEPWCPRPELDAARLRQEVLGSLVAWVGAVAAQSPLMLVVDDLQWADPTTVELLGTVAARKIPGLLLVVTARHDSAVRWSSPTTIEVGLLSRDELLELAHRLPESRGIEPEHLDALIDRSDGIPLFLEELLRGSVLPEGPDLANRARVPPGLRDLLLAPFAAPGVDLRVAQLLATAGWEVPASVIEAASELDPEELQRRLSAMVAAEIISAAGTGPTIYRFRHHLLADLAYDSQLQPDRRQAHARVAAALASTACDPGVLAHHWELADRPEEAVDALASAVEAAQALGASAEADHLLTRAADLLERVPPARRPVLELQVRLLRGAAAAAVMGYAAPQAVVDFAVAQSLVPALRPEGHLDDGAPAIGSRPVSEIVWSVSGLWATLMLQGRLDDADRVNIDLVARLRPDGELRPYFVSSRSFIDFFRGDYDAAAQGLQASLDHLDRIELPARLPLPNDPTSTARAHLAFVEAMRGRFAAADALADTALDDARALAFPRGPFSACYALGMRAATEATLGRPDRAAAFAAEQVELAERHGYVFWTMVGGVHQATLDLQAGDESAGQRASMTIAILRQMGVLVWLPSFLAALAAVHLERGEVAAAEAHLADAGDVAEQSGAHYWSAEIGRLRALARLAHDDPSGIELLRESVALATRQGAELFQLRGWVALCERSDDPDDHKALGSLVDRLGVGAGADLPDIVSARSVLIGRR